MEKFKEVYDYYKTREFHLGKKEQEYLKQLTKLNSLYTELEYETDNKTIIKIKRQIKEIERQLKEQ